MDTPQNDIVQTIRSIANSESYTERTKVGNILDILKAADWSELADVYDELLKILLDIPTRLGPGRGMLVGCLLGKKTNAEYQEHEGDDHYDYIKSIFDYIMHNELFRDEDKESAIGNAFVYISEIDITEEDFYRLTEEIEKLNYKQLKWKSKIEILTRLGRKVLKNHVSISEMASKLDQRSDNRLASEVIISLWKRIPDEEKDISEIGRLYTVFDSNLYMKNQNERRLTSLVLPIDINTNPSLIPALINEVKDIKCDVRLKQLILAKILLRVERKEENNLIIQELYDEIVSLHGEEEKQNDSIKLDEMGMPSAFKLGYYDYSSVDTLTDSIAYGDVVDIGIIDNWYDFSNIERRNIINSLKSLIKKGNPILVEEGAILRFIQLINHKILPIEEEDKEELNTLFNDLLSRTDIPNHLDEYERRIDEGKMTLSSDELKDFEKQAKKYRCKGDRLPSKVRDYIIREAIRSNIDRFKYPELVQGAELDLASDFLLSLGEQSYYVFHKDNINLPTRAAQNFTYKYLYYNVNCYNSNNVLSNDTLPYMLSTSFHEPRHAWQGTAEKKGLLDKRIFIMSEEKAIEKLDNYYYNKHYFDMEEEVDARIFGLLTLTDYLLSIGLSLEEIVRYLTRDMENEIIESGSKDIDDEIEFDKKRNRSIKQNQEGKNLTISETLMECFSLHQKKTSVDDIFQELPLLSLKYKIVYPPDRPDCATVVLRSDSEIDRIHQYLNSKISDENERRCVYDLFDYIKHGERVVDHSEYTNGEYLEYYDYDIENGLEGLTKFSPYLTDFPIFEGPTHNTLIKELQDSQPEPGTPVV